MWVAFIELGLLLLLGSLVAWVVLRTEKKSEHDKDANDSDRNHP